MNKLSFIALVLAASCGDNAKVTNDGSTGSGDSGGNFPAAPSLGTQIDRLGRPAINTALNHGFDADVAAAGSAKDDYNANGSPGSWTSYAAQFAANLAVLDALDGTCGNQVLYNGTAAGGGTPAADSYATLAATLTDDELYVDTTKAVAELSKYHQGYLAVELNVVAAVPNQTCGGRAPTLDVMDTSYSALAAGISGFNVSDEFKPAVGDGVDVHADVSNTAFPFFGAPHS